MGLPNKAEKDLTSLPSPTEETGTKSMKLAGTVTSFMRDPAILLKVYLKKINLKSNP